MSLLSGSSYCLDSRIIPHVESRIAKSKIFVVSKTRCPACIQAKDLFNKQALKTGVVPMFFNLDQFSKQEVKMIVKHLSARTGIKTVPQIWINGRFIGGNDDIQRINREGRLISLISGTKSGYGSHPNRFVNRSSTFTGDDDNKYDPEKVNTRHQPLSTRISNSLGASLGSRWSNSTSNLVSSRMYSARRSVPHHVPQQLSMPLLKELNNKNSYWSTDNAVLSRPAVVTHSHKPSRKNLIEGVLISRVI